MLEVLTWVGVRVSGNKCTLVNIENKLFNKVLFSHILFCILFAVYSYYLFSSIKILYKTSYKPWVDIVRPVNACFVYLPVAFGFYLLKYRIKEVEQLVTTKIYPF